MDGEDPGLLGGLPRERRGTRSDKRQEGSSARPPKRPAAAKRPAGQRPAAARPPDEPPDAIGPIRGAGRIAGAGLRVAGGVTRGVLRRLPRP
jgi:hypothetical protein